jgi:hypothetical protein
MRDKIKPHSLHLARVYWRAGDPAAAKRTWQNVMDEISIFLRKRRGDMTYAESSKRLGLPPQLFIGSSNASKASHCAVLSKSWIA